MDETRPDVLPGETYHLYSNAGDIYVTINGASRIEEVFIHVGKCGEEVSALTYTIRIMINSMLSMDEGPGVLEIIRMLKGVKGEILGRFRFQTFSSLAEAIALAMEAWLDVHEVEEEKEESDEEIPESE